MRPFSSSFTLAAATVSAHSIRIASPPVGSSFTRGQSFLVELDFPDTLTGTRYGSLVISHIACGMQMCDIHDFANASLEDVLYSGDFTPSCSDDPSKPPRQNFTVTLPTGTPAGSSLLNVAHFMLIGAEAQPNLESKNVSLIIQTPVEDGGSSLAKTRWFRTTFVHDLASILYLCFVLATDLNRDL